MIKNFFSLVLLVFFSPASYSITFKKQSVTLEKIPLQVQIADTEAKRSRGLMFQEALRPNEGMLFIYEEKGFKKIWMFNMKFSIDIIWFNENKKVVYFEENVPPCLKDYGCMIYSSPKESLYILEVSAGFVRSNKISKNYTLNLD